MKKHDLDEEKHYEGAEQEEAEGLREASQLVGVAVNACAVNFIEDKE